MYSYILRFLSVIFFGALVACSAVSSSTKTADAAAIPATIVTTTSSATTENMQTAVFAGGCFWGLEAVFQHVTGVTGVMSGYTGGAADTANYETVSTGTTGHAESVKVTFDPSKVSYRQLLDVFFKVAHDPTELNRQGPDTGTQYRSAIFYTNDEQKQAAQNYIDNLTAAKIYTKPIVTQVVPLTTFYQSEDYHHNYLKRHPDDPYIVYNDIPKVENLQKDFPALYIAN